MRELFDEVAGQSPFDPQEAVRRSTRIVQRKRFYETAGVGEGENGFAVLLDGRAVKTPSGKPLTAPTRSIAEIIAAEWNAQSELIDPTSMPMTRLGNSVVEGVTDRVDDVVADIAKYFGTDLLCYRAGHPEALVAREARAWDPLLFWAAERFGAHLVLAQGIMHVDQPAQALAALQAALPRAPWAAGAFHVVTTITGSALLALALAEGFRDAGQVWAAAHIDEDWNAEQWGIDEEVAARRAQRLVDFTAAARVLAASS